MKWPQQFRTKGDEIINKINLSNTTPDKKDILRFLDMDPSNIKVVIIGQDPYPTQGVANGRAFAVNKGTNIPQSLKNLFKEIKEIQGFIKTDETLDSWTSQGVLLLNAALTTKIGNPNAHSHYWKEYTHNIITFLDKKYPDITWVLWGNFAQKLGECINGKKIIDAHPSPLSVRHRTKITFKELKNIQW